MSELIQVAANETMGANARASAMDTLGTLRPPAAVPTLIAALESENSEVRGSATLALSNIETTEAIQAVEDLYRKLSIHSTEIRIQRPTTNYDGMMLIPAGEFQMGNEDGHPSERPVHAVTLDAFYMDVGPVTVGSYQKFVEATGYSAPSWESVATNSPTDDHPMILVNWRDAMAYADWAGVRLPTEAEWEYAARGGLVGKTYPWGDEPPSKRRVNFKKWFGRQTVPVGTCEPNGYGLHNMAGNIWEWCLDTFHPSFYALGPADNPVAIDPGNVVGGVFLDVKTQRIIRGSGWLGNSPSRLRVSCRRSWEPDDYNPWTGFRCVVPASQR